MGIGSLITTNLTNYGLNVTHLKDYNDYPDYNSSYANSNYAVKQVLSNSKKNLIIDYIEMEQKKIQAMKISCQGLRL